jgi:hypothetical protein
MWQGRISNGLRRSRSMNLELLREQLQENLISYLETVVACDHHDSYLYDGVIDTACQIVVDTFKEVGV